MCFKMEVLIAHIILYSVFYVCAVCAGKHDSIHDPNKPRPPDNDVIDNGNEHLLEVAQECIYVSFDHDEFTTNVMYCMNGCCGTMEEQKCCKSEEDKKRGDYRLINTMIVVTGILAIICVSCCIFGIYKHKMAKRRKTRPNGQGTSTSGVHTRTNPYLLFFTPGSGAVPTAGKTQGPNRPYPTNQSTIPSAPTEARTPPAEFRSPPPSYSDHYPQQMDGLHEVNSPPPPYTPR